MIKPHNTREPEVLQEHPMVKTILAELQTIDDRRQWEDRFYKLMDQRSHIGIPVQYERLFLYSSEEKEEKKHDHQRSRKQSNRRRISHSTDLMG
jgi:hypothetical protein